MAHIKHIVAVVCVQPDEQNEYPHGKAKVNNIARTILPHLLSVSLGRPKAIVVSQGLVQPKVWKPNFKVEKTLCPSEKGKNKTNAMCGSYRCAEYTVLRL